MTELNINKHIYSKAFKFLAILVPHDSPYTPLQAKWITGSLESFPKYVCCIYSVVINYLTDFPRHVWKKFLKGDWLERALFIRNIEIPACRNNSGKCNN